MTTLTDKQSKAIDALRHGGTIADVAERLGMPKSSAGNLIMRLRNRGYVKLTHVASNKPALLELTESGRAAWAGSLR